MKFHLTSKIEKNTALVLVSKNGGGIESHIFFRHLPREDKEYVKKLVKENFFHEEFVHFLSPSGTRFLVVNAGEQKKFDWRRVIKIIRQIVVLAKKEKIKTFEINWDDFTPAEKEINKVDILEAIGTQMELANFEFVSHKTLPKDGWNFVEQVFICGNNHADDNSEEMFRALSRGKIIGEEINSARILANAPGGEMTPSRLAEAAVKAGKRAGFKTKILEEQEMKRLKMGGIIGVSRGSLEKPKLIIAEYLNGKASEKPIVLVGKGVTFDSGGLNLKPDGAIYEMHMDMSGGAAVIHTVAALARLKIKKNIIGIVPAAENMPSGSSYRPGDLLKTMSGKTIEVLNTDAEGRIILADALTYAQKYKPHLIIDAATLTGAAVVALGQRASALFTNDENLGKLLRDAGERTGDYVWPLPLWREYDEEIKGTFGDIINVGRTKYGGAITGAVFLRQFIGMKEQKESSGEEQNETSWAHIDIAPRMTAIDSDFLAKGATGVSVNLLVHFLRKH